MFGKGLAQRGHREKNFATACQRENGGDAFGMNVGMRTYCFVITALMLLVTSAAAQWPPPTSFRLYPLLIQAVHSFCRSPRRSRSRLPPAEVHTKANCHRSNRIRGRVASSAGTRAIHRSAAFSTMGRAFPIICRRSDKICGSQSFQPMKTTRSSKTVEMGGSMRSVRFATCLRRFALAGCRPRNRRRDMVWNTPSASLLSAMAP
jgi:hypothetical protein